MSVGERILELRKKQNMSQGDLADAMAVSRQAVSKWENDASSPDTLKLIQLAEVLDTDVEYLATGRSTVLRRPPVVIKTTEVVEKIVEKPVEIVIEKPVDRIVERTVVEYVEKPVIKEVPVIKKVVRTKYIRRPVDFIFVGIICLAAGILIGLLF